MSQQGSSYTEKHSSRRKTVRKSKGELSNIYSWGPPTPGNTYLRIGISELQGCDLESGGRTVKSEFAVIKTQNVPGSGGTWL